MIDSTTKRGNCIGDYPPGTKIKLAHVENIITVIPKGGEFVNTRGNISLYDSEKKHITEEENGYSICIYYGKEWAIIVEKAKDIINNSYILI